MLRTVIRAADRAPALPILIELGLAADAMLRAEDFGEREIIWSIVESDAAAATELRQMMIRRNRWIDDFDHMLGVVESRFLQACDTFIDLLPESCFEDWDESDEHPFEVSLIDLIDDPAEAVERFLMIPYEDDALRCDLFSGLRSVCQRNLLIASGVSPAADIVEWQEKLILPEKQKWKRPAELVDLYLGGTPFQSVMEIGVPFRVPDETRFEHCHIIGGTGHGKTQLMQRMIHGDLIAATKARRSVVVIDSQGDLINKLMRLDLFAPDAEGNLADRLVIIDPSDIEFPASLNLFDAHLDRLKD